MAKKFWWPKRLADQMNLVSVFRGNFPSVGEELGFTSGDIAEALELCDSILAAFTYTESLASTMRATTAWRNQVFYGRQRGAAAVDPPPPLPVTPANYVEGSVDMFFRLRDRILASPKCTGAIGTGLGLIGPEKMKLTAAEAVPELKISVDKENYVRIAGSLKGCDALQVQYAPHGEDFATAAYLTRTPGGFQLHTKQAGVPEKGNLRAVFIKANEQYGSFSNIYPVGLW